MPQEPRPVERINSLSDFYEPDPPPLIKSLEAWDHNWFVPLAEADPALYRLICNQIGDDFDILIGQGCVKLGRRLRQITMTWNGDEEDLLDLLLDGSKIIAD
ncbi:MAG: hypothetical protein ACT4OM_06335 [Actinomycetota bacterium]